MQVCLEICQKLGETEQVRILRNTLTLGYIIAMICLLLYQITNIKIASLSNSFVMIINMKAAKHAMKNEL